MIKVMKPLISQEQTNYKHKRLEILTEKLKSSFDWTVRNLNI